MNKIVSYLIISTLAFVALGCGAQSEGDRVAGATVEVACLAQDFLKEFDLESMMADAQNMTMAELKELQEKAEAKQEEMEGKMQDILAKYDFENEDNFQEIAANYENDGELREKATQMAMDKCGIDLDEFEKMMGEF